MSRRMIFASLSSLALSGFALGICPAIAPADQLDSGTTRPGWVQPGASDPSKSGDDFNPVYDVSAAAAKSAQADTQVSQAYNNYVGVTLHVQSEFKASNDYRAAVKAADDAQAAYDAACAPVLDAVHRDAAYTALTDRRDRLQLVMETGRLSPQGRIDVATMKMEVSSQATRMEGKALRDDANVRQARAKWDDAREALSAKEAQFSASMYTNPMVVEAKQAYEAAVANQAAAKGLLNGALLARADTVDADRRRYNGQVTTYVDPYNYGYYGLGNGYYGTNLSVGRFNNGR